MARDNHPRLRQAKKVARKKASKNGADRILIVCEGSKTEVNYFEDIRKELRLPTANIYATRCEYGTSPLQVVSYACDLFVSGDREKGIPPRSFEKVFAVFDRDDHKSYFDALNKAEGMKLKNDLNKLIEFKAVVSKPSFELWLLLHFFDQRAWFARHEILSKLKNYIPKYEKGQKGIYDLTKAQFDIAKQRAVKLGQQATARDEDTLYTDIYEVIDVLIGLGQ